MSQTHFQLEGQVEFKALLYVPSVVPFELNRDMFNEGSKAIKLYVKRVFINDKFEELMPRWLTFVSGPYSVVFLHRQIVASQPETNQIVIHHCVLTLDPRYCRLRRPSFERRTRVATKVENAERDE